MRHEVEREAVPKDGAGKLFRFFHIAILPDKSVLEPVFRFVPQVGTFNVQMISRYCPGEMAKHDR